MATEAGVKVVIGAALAASFQSVLGGVKRTLSDLGAVARQLQDRHDRLGQVMARAMSHPARQRYDALGRTLEQIRRSFNPRPALRPGEAGDGQKDMLEKGSGETGGQVLVVKATQTGKALWVTSFRRLRSSDARRDSEIRRLLKKEQR